MIRQKQNFLGAKWTAPADSIPNVFFDSSVVPSFLVRKVENKSFPCTHKIGERTGQLCRDNSRRVGTHELRTNCSPIHGHTLGTKHFFVPNQGVASAWNFGNSSVKVGSQGLFLPVLENFCPAFSPDPTDRPWVSEDVHCFELLIIFNKLESRSFRWNRGSLLGIITYCFTSVATIMTCWF